MINCWYCRGQEDVQCMTERPKRRTRGSMETHVAPSVDVSGHAMVPCPVCITEDGWDAEGYQPWQKMLTLWGLDEDGEALTPLV